jgi:PKD repeat protein
VILFDFCSVENRKIMRTSFLFLILTWSVLWIAPPSAFSQCGPFLGFVSEEGCGLIITNANDPDQRLEPIGGGDLLSAGQLIRFDYLEFNDGNCSDAQSVFLLCTEDVTDCVEPAVIDPTANCEGNYEPVCGCDEVTYANACQAQYVNGLLTWTDGPCPGTPLVCEADFMFGYINSNTVVFYNNSLGYNTTEWTFSDQDATIVSSTDESIVVTFTTTAPEVCLTITNTDGCSNQICRTITIDHPDELCHQTDCVWPGDTNGDGKANVFDLKNIGLGFNAMGPMRPFFPDPDNPNFWAPSMGHNWDLHVGAVDYKHIDCDGNGWINVDDIDAININYTPDVDYPTLPPDPSGLPIYLEFEETEITLDDDSPAFIEITAHLYVGTSDNVAMDLHGFAFSLSYPLDLVQPNTVTVDYDDNSFFGQINDVLTVREDLAPYGIGRYDLAFSRKGGDGANGYGKVATIQFIVIGDIIGGREEPEVDFQVEYAQAELNDGIGDLMPYDTLNAGSVVTFIDNFTLSNTPTILEENGVELFPNPVRDQLRIQLGTAQFGQVRLFDAAGSVVRSAVLNGDHLYMETQSTGIGYLLRAGLNRQRRNKSEGGGGVRGANISMFSGKGLSDAHRISSIEYRILIIEYCTWITVFHWRLLPLRLFPPALLPGHHSSYAALAKYLFLLLRAICSARAQHLPGDRGHNARLTAGGI